MKKKLLTMVLVLSMVITSTACSENNSSLDVSDTKATKVQEEEGNVNEGELSGRIEFFSQKSEALDIMQAVIDEFSKEYPEVEVELVTVPDAEQVIKSRLATGSMPEVFTDWPLNPDYKLFAKEGYLYDMSDQAYLSNANQEVLDMTKVDGTYYTVPLSLNYTGIYYNVDIFEANGLKVPESYEALLEVCTKLEANGVQPFMVSDKDVWTIGAFADRAMGLIFDDKGELFETVGKGEKSVGDSEGFMTMVNQILKIREYAGTDTLGIGYEQAVADFANGKAAMMYQGTWMLPLVKKANPDMNVAMFPYPAVEASETRVGVNIDNAVCISAGTEEIELANAFVGFITSTKGAQIYADMDGSPSAIKGVKSDSDEFAAIEALVEEGKTFRISRTYWKPGMIQDLQGNIQLLILDKDIDAFVNAMDESIKIYYAE